MNVFFSKAREFIFYISINSAERINAGSGTDVMSSGNRHTCLNILGTILFTLNQPENITVDLIICNLLDLVKPILIYP